MGGEFEVNMQWGRMCFNAAKTYVAGWYSNHHGDVSPDVAPYNGNIVDVNSASLGLIQKQGDVVVRVGGNLYFMLHRLEGITSDMVQKYHETHANRVNVVSQVAPMGVGSNMVASLASGERYIQHNWAQTGKDLHIKVCSIAEDSRNGGAKVIVYLEGETFTSCDDDISTSPPTSAISTFPSSAPSEHVPPTSPPHPTCTDSTLKMFIRGRSKRACSWVAANKTEERCMIPGVASHCPVTCGACIMCVDSGKRFQMKNQAKDIKSCSWVRRTDTASRCKKEGVASACRATCGICNA